MAKAEHRIEACLQRSKSAAGLADYEGRHWTGWQHHQTLSLLATWFLERDTQREKWTPAMTLPQIRQGIAMIVREAFPCGTMAHRLEERPKRWRRNELARFYHWKRRNQWLHETYRNDCSKTPVKTVELMCYPILPMARRALV